VSGPVRLGFSGSAKEGDVQLRLALVEVDATVAGDDSFCVDLLRDLADLYESLTFGPIDVRLKDGATGTATSTLGDGQIDVKISIST
jgi:hypothetical protein